MFSKRFNMQTAVAYKERRFSGRLEHIWEWDNYNFRLPDMDKLRCPIRGLNSVCICICICICIYIYIYICIYILGLCSPKFFSSRPSPKT